MDSLAADKFDRRAPRADNTDNTGYSGPDRRDNRLRRKSDPKLGYVFSAGVLTGGCVVTLAIVVALTLFK